MADPGLAFDWPGAGGVQGRERWGDGEMGKPGRVTLTVGLVLMSVFATASHTPAQAATETTVYDASATLSGPITAGHIIEPGSGVAVNLAAHGYVEQEFFASGTAHAFTATSMSADGRWSIQPSTSA